MVAAFTVGPGDVTDTEELRDCVVFEVKLLLCSMDEVDELSRSAATIAAN